MGHNDIQRHQFWYWRKVHVPLPVNELTYWQTSLVLPQHWYLTDGWKYYSTSVHFIAAFIFVSIALSQTPATVCLLTSQLLDQYQIILLGERHINVNNLPKVIIQQHLAETWTIDLLITNPMSWQVNHHTTLLLKVDYLVLLEFFQMTLFLSFR